MLNYWGIFFMFGVMPVCFCLLAGVTYWAEKNDKKIKEVHVNEC